LKTEGTPELRRDAEMAVFRAHLERFGIPPVFNEMARFGLDAITEPILAMNVGLRDPDGKPLEPAATRAAIEQVRFVEAGLIRWLGEKPDRLFQIEPRAFEQVVAELFWKQKYEVTLTPQTRDGGKDIYAVKRDSFADFLCIVECKRYAPDSPVDVDIVRSLYGVQNAERAAMSIIATTSRFTADARKLHKKFDTQMALREYADVVRWINEYLKT
jgi:restriction system protein